MVLVDVHVVVSRRTVVAGLHHEVVRQAEVIVVVNRCRNPARQTLNTPVPEHGRDHATHAAAFQESVHGMQHGGRVRAIVVRVRVVVATLDLGDEIRELAMFHTEVLQNTIAAEEKVEEPAKRPITCDARELDRIKFPAVYSLLQYLEVLQGWLGDERVRAQHLLRFKPSVQSFPGGVLEDETSGRDLLRRSAVPLSLLVAAQQQRRTDAAAATEAWERCREASASNMPLPWLGLRVIVHPQSRAHPPTCTPWCRRGRLRG
mmetsp:Transcript_15129/g.53117  ORF Transcript_15129/g.53117 Transcript_15129/m.53117 type:complete len:261 (+) Transcript_15129:635-1417(+)